MDPRVKKIATIALNLAMKGDWEESGRYIKRLSGTDGLLHAMTAWIDTMIAEVYPEHRPGQAIAVKFFAIETEEIGGADDVDWEKAWAGRLISYRAAKDWEGFHSVLTSVPEGKPLAAGINALMNIVVSSLNNVEKTREAAAKIQRGAS
jgi:hypothetical protein